MRFCSVGGKSKVGVSWHPEASRTKEGTHMTKELKEALFTSVMVLVILAMFWAGMVSPIP
jgi:hypothetical protein